MICHKFARLPNSVQKNDLVGHMIPLSHSSVEEYFKKVINNPNHKIIAIQVFSNIYLTS